MLITTVLLIVLTPVLGASALLFAGWGIAQWAAGREFTGIWEAGDVASALHAEVLQRSHDSHSVTQQLLM